jgi:hypothetical protein
MKKVSVKSKWIDLDEYLDLLKCFPSTQVTIYHQSLWLGSVSSGFGVSIKCIATFNLNGNLEAVTPFMSTNKWPFRLLGSPLSGLFTEFMGPIFMHQDSNENHATILQSQSNLARSQAHYVEWGVQSSLSKKFFFDTFNAQGYDYISRPTIVLDLLQGEDNLWTKLKGRSRNMIRKSKKSGVRAIIVKPTPEWMTSYYEMLEQTYSRQGRKTPHPLSFYLRIVEIAKAGKAYCISAEFENRSVAKAIFLINNKQMFYFSGTSNNEGMKLAANSLVQWKAICTAISDDVHLYDMGGLGVPSIDKFKRSFGGEEVAHHRWVYKTLLFRIIEPIAIWLSKKGLIKIGKS